MVEIKAHPLNRIKTTNKNSGKPNGILMPLWKDYDPIDSMTPRFVYYTTCLAGEDKGPYFHTKRRTLLNLVEGKIVFVYRENNLFKEIVVDSDNPSLLDVPAGIGYLIRNPHSKEAKIVNICDYPWREGDNETQTPDFSDYQPSF